MIARKKIILCICSLFVLIGVFAVIPIISDYIEYKNVVRAAGGACPMSDGVNIATVLPCVRTTPVILPVTCTQSCPVLDPILTAICSAPIAEAVACISANTSNPEVCIPQVKSAIECQACENYYEVIPATSQRAIPVFGVPKTFVNYKGGGTTIVGQNGKGMIWCGDSNVSPIIVGVPSLAVKTIDKIVAYFKNQF